MTPDEFKETWHGKYSLCLPIASCLRSAYADFWMRIHTLPDSKRYADNEQEMLEILRRHNKILNDLFNVDSTYYVVTVGYSSDQIPVTTYSKLYDELPSVYLFSQSIEESQDEPCYWHFYYSEREWKLNGEDSILRLIADDEVENVLFVNFDKSIIYHPYDGGADIIFPSMKIRDDKIEQYSEWLSSHSSGL
jgi:hypothetical protein